MTEVRAGSFIARLSSSLASLPFALIIFLGRAPQELHKYYKTYSAHMLRS
jgi:hypothetical protein